MIARFLLLCALTFLVIHVECRSWPQKRLLDIHHLHLQYDRYTTGNKPVKQLSCTGDYSLCDSYAPKAVDCYNLGYIKGSIRWRCETVFSSKDIAFDKLDVGCEKAEDGWYGDSVIEGSCGLTYTLRTVSPAGAIIGWIVGVIVLILFFACVVFVCMKCCEGGVSSGGTVYTTHSPNVIRPATVYSTPVIAPAVIAPTYYPSPAYTTTSVGFSGTSYRNDGYDNNTHVSTGFAGTTFRNDDYSSGYTGGNDYSSNTDTGYAGTSFR